MTNNKLPEIGKRNKLEPTLDLVFSQFEIKYNDFWERFEELPNQEPTSAENAPVDKAQETLEEFARNYEPRLETIAPHEVIEIVSAYLENKESDEH